jgi:predicted F0F1-ATPase subunit
MTDKENKKKHEISKVNDKARPQLPKNNEEKGSNFMNLIAEVSTLAWNLVIPIVGGVILGNYLDNRNNSGATWTLSLLTLGVIIAFSNLYNLYIEHGRKKEKKNKMKTEDKEENAKE